MSGIDYKATYFQHPVLTKVHGEPTYDALQQIATQVKANAAAVPSQLGGGNHGHLGLVYTSDT